ncbi:class I SAM-dependent methyltransferase [Rufibacter latericius]|uniref:hypothetical protein n=1 Tax=Rufibacter latericius TaxID=2487040 RepID=UPI000F62AAC0|nr:hypothetical protein [Rufibacter latericius]
MTGTEPKDFFKQPRKASEIKAEILSRFFPVWSELAVAGQKEAAEAACLYLDLNVGTGSLEGGLPDASHRVLKQIFAGVGSRPHQKAVFRSFFGESNKNALAAHLQATEALPFFPELETPPVWVKDQESQKEIREKLQTNLPALLVTDPFGYKFSQEMLGQALENNATDVFLLFEGSKLKASVKSASAPGALQHLYGTHLAALQQFYERTAQAQKREEFALKTLENVLRGKGFRTVTFKFGTGKEQPQQYLVFASRSETTCTKLKEILLDYSDYQEDGVPLLAANLKPLRLLIPEYAQYLPFSLYKLQEDLLQNASAYNRLSLEKIYEKHNVETPYSRANYLTVMEKLKEQGKILLLNPKTAQQVHKLSYSCLIKFKA